MTIQDDLARPWFEPLVPTEQRKKDQPRLDPEPLTTRIVGELPVGDARTPAHPEPAALEVTQPYIPAIREQAPEFVKRLPADDPPLPMAQPLTTPGSGGTSTPAAPQPQVQPPRQPAAPVKRRSLARRVVRRILGPDLLRKDPPKKKR